MLEGIPQKYIELAIITAVVAVLWLLGWGIKMAIEERKHRENQARNKLVTILAIIFEGIGNAVQLGGAGLAALCAVVLLIILPLYVVLHFIVKYW